MKKAVIWGAGQVGVSALWHIALEYEVLGFVDSDTRRQTTTHLAGGKISPIRYNGKTYEIYPPHILATLQPDCIFITTISDLHIEQIRTQLQELGLGHIHTDVRFAYVVKYARLHFIQMLAFMQARDGIRGSVAELGVWRGECARYINHCFNDERFYLLDTFEGFDARDIAAERGAAKSASTNDFANTSLESVRSNLIYPDKCVFVKGYFPQTATQIPQDEVFRFVNIDVDLYQPILAGLEFFYPRLVGGGAILVHDYFHPFYTGTRLAVDEFCTTHALKPLPIGDGFSVMITKPL